MGKNVPELRFLGFSEEWEERKLEELLEIRRILMKQSSETPRLAFASGQGVIPLSERKTNNRDQLIADEYSKNYLLTEYNDIVYNPANLKYGAIDRNKYGRGVISPIYVTFVTTEMPEFIERIVTTDRFRNKALQFEEGTVIKRQMVSPANLLSFSEMITTIKEEQTQIGTLFQTLDTLITKAQQKHQKLLAIKKAMLTKMFPQKGQTVPEVRFQGFSGEWERKELGEVSERITRKNENNESDLPLTISAQYGLVDQYNYFNNRVASKNVSNYYLIKKGEFAYNKSYSDGYPFGAVKCLEKYEIGVLSTLYIIFSLDNSQILNDYLTSFYETELWYKDVSEKAAEGARNHGLLNITASDFLETTVIFPKDLEEQTLIGNFFRELDHQISLQADEIQSLQNLKQALLSKMFVS